MSKTSKQCSCFWWVVFTALLVGSCAQNQSERRGYTNGYTAGYKAAYERMNTLKYGK